MSSSIRRTSGSEASSDSGKWGKNPPRNSNSFGSPSRCDTASDAKQPSILSLEGSERVIPIRSIVSINPNILQSRGVSKPPDDNQSVSASSVSAVDTDGVVLNSAPHSVSNADNIAECDRPSISSPQTQPQDVQDESQHYLTSRHEHVSTGENHSVKIGGSQRVFQRCEDEPIRIPGAVQSFGVMIALREESPDQIVVRVASENSEHVLGYSPQQLFALHSFSDILEADQMAKFTEHLDYVRDDGHDLEVEGPEVFLLSIKLPCGDSRRFWCATHVSQENKDIIICEFELEEDEENPLNVEDQLPGMASGMPTPTNEDPSSVTPTSVLGINPTPAQIAASTISSSRSFRALRFARRRRGESAAMQIFNTISPIQEQLSQPTCLEELLEITAGLVKELVGFHRVLIYQFDNNWNGKVVAELVDPQVTVDLYKGLHFPASDIPRQARELYKVNKVRLLYDRDAVTSRLVCRTLEDLETPLDMTHAYLRAMSPIHTKYLANMGVRSSMSISINAFGNLWGLISCHSYGSTGMRVSFPIRRLCRIIGDTVARNIERIKHAESIQEQHLLKAVPQEADPTSYIVASSDDLLRFLKADSGVLLMGKEARVICGNSHAEDSFSQEMLALLEYLRVRRIESVFTSRDITQEFPDFQYAPGLRNIAGLLYVPFTTSADHFLVFLRRGQLTTVTWAGNPHEVEKRKQTIGSGQLTPRQSFKEWSETVLSQSQEWSESEIATATLLSKVYSKFVKVWQEKEAIKGNSRLTRLLVANSAHEVRTPLNAIINYLELALEGTVDRETRESLINSHSASKSLIYTINDLLDLTTTRPKANQQIVNDNSFDLCLTFREATAMLAGEAKRKNVSFSQSVHPGIPTTAMGDQRRVRQVFTNLISNAIQNTPSGFIKVEMRPSTTQKVLPGHTAIEMIVIDTGSGISKAKRERLFLELEEVFADDEYSGDEADDEIAKGIQQEKGVLGLGLALTARIVHNMHGQLSFKSEEGKGSQFKILLQFRCPEQAEAEAEASLKEFLPNEKNDLDISMGPDAENYTLQRAPHADKGDGRQRVDENPSSGKAPETPSLSSQHTVPEEGLSSTQRMAPDTVPIDPKQTPINMRFIDDSSAFHLRHPSTDKQSSTSENPSLNLGSTAPPLKSPSSDFHHSIQSTGSPQLSERNTKPSSQSQSTRSESYFPRMSSTETGTSDRSNSILSPPTEPSTASLSSGKSLHVLVAEDDPINSMIVKKRLERLGHKVHLTNNGEACFNAFTAQRNAFDVILMDIQMPIVDGMTATKMIRELESKIFQSQPESKTNPEPEPGISTSSEQGHVPIFAVSASIVERNENSYIDCGFSGWIMKPIDFSRLNTLLAGVIDPCAEVRRLGSQEPREWEFGGWFE